MLNKLLKSLRQYEMVAPGEHVICAVSGGADSVALLFGMYLLREKLGIQLSAVHFNHGLRGAESDRDEEFVRKFCRHYDIELTVGRQQVVAGKKGLEAAAREARYAFFATLSGKIATAHTADDNAETVLMHLVRGTGLRGLGGIRPVNQNVIRPMLAVTRQEVLAFLEEYCLSYVEDSSNGTDDFLRNRLRHRVMPLLKEENPRLAESVSQMAMQLQEDADALEEGEITTSIPELRAQSAPIRSRGIALFLKENGVKEPERKHIRLVEAVVFSEKPSACADLPNGVRVGRRYDCLAVLQDKTPPQEVTIFSGQQLELPQWGVVVSMAPAEQIINTQTIFTVCTKGPVTIRSRQTGDEMRLNIGTQRLKKLFIDRKIPADLRSRIPVFADKNGILGVGGIGANVDRIAKTLPAMQIRLEYLD